MTLKSWLAWKYRWLKWRLFNIPRPENPCPRCGRDMTMEDKSTMSGYDMRTRRCHSCGHQEIVNTGMAAWKAMSGNFDD